MTTTEVVTRDLLIKMDKGDPLTDSELESLIGFYYELETKLSILGPHFYLSLREICRYLDHLRGIKSFRNHA